MFISGCTAEVPRIDSAKSSLHIEVKRLERRLFKANSGNISPEEYASLNADFGTFFDLFLSRIIEVGRASDSSTLYYLNHFRSDAQVIEIAGKSLEAFPDLAFVNDELTGAFRRYETAFPGAPLPDVYSYISAFSYGMVVDDSILGIGLDMYLGAGNEYYRRLGIPVYKTRGMDRHYITRDCISAWLMTEFDAESEKADLLSQMIYHGKVLYALELLMPDSPDSIRTPFSAEQLLWLEKNEKDMWFHFAENDILFSSESGTIQKYLGEGPFTAGFPEGSPGGAGRWTGYRIVRKYMLGHNALDLKSLFLEKDSRKILKMSKYK